MSQKRGCVSFSVFKGSGCSVAQSHFVGGGVEWFCVSLCSIPDFRIPSTHIPGTVCGVTEVCGLTLGIST